MINTTDIKVGDIVTVLYKYPDYVSWFSENEDAEENPLRGEVTEINGDDITISSPIMQLPARVTVKISKVIRHWKFMGEHDES